MLLFAVTIFLSAFLLFQVQPMIAKFILPWFGGTAAVWATCLVFFQTTLLVGYLYAHGLIRRLTAKQQALVHAALLACAALLLPIIPAERMKPGPGDNPTLGILVLLAVTVGLPYFLLSTTGPLLQAWMVRWRPGTVPYRLFALSNLGSMLGLLTYPVAVEPTLSLRHQAWGWSGGFIVFAILAVCAALKTLKPLAAVADAPGDEDPPPPDAPRWPRYALWILLPACPSMMLLAVTTYLTQDVASIPFLWVAPLAIYLLTFILCFDAEGWYRRWLFLALAGPALGGMSWLCFVDVTNRPALWLFLLLYLVCFFAACMVCHGELARTKPDPSHLTVYYLMISVGGALGGAAVAMGAPLVFNSTYELPLSFAFCTVMVLVVLFSDRGSYLRRDWLSVASIATFVVAAALLGFEVRVTRNNAGDNLAVVRNFYGVMKVRQTGGVYDWESYRTLVHGAINHGEQYSHPARRKEVATYYCADSGFGVALNTRVLGNPQRIGIVGLGAGTIAAYGRAGDAYRFYEINPLVQRVANQHFWYLKDSDAVVEVALGDARLTMEREAAQNYDVLAVDAFSSDAIPVHLLTLESIRLYFRHLRPEGILAVHISNRFINLQPVLERAAQALGLKQWVVDTDDSDDGKCFGTTWVLLARDDRWFTRSAFQGVGRPIQANPWLKPWTDDYSNIIKLLK